MDLSNFSDDQIEIARDRAKAAEDMPNELMFENELIKRQKKSLGETNIVEQGMTGINEALAKGFGTPVDIVGSGLRSLGIDVPQNAFGGSESIKQGFDILSGGQAFSNVAPKTSAQRVVRKTGTVLGETLPATLGLIGAAPKAMSAGKTAYDAFKNVLANVRKEAGEAPAKFAATEAAIATGAGVAAGSIEDMFPNNPTAETIAEMLGAAGGAVGVKSAERLLAKKIQGPLTPEDLKREAGKLYDEQRDTGLSAQPEVTEKILSDTFSMLDRSGYLQPVKGSNRVVVATDYSKLRPIVSMLEAYADKGMTAANIQTMRRAIAGRMRDAKGEERNALRNVLRTFDENTSELAPQIKVANAMYSRAMKADQVEELVELAKASALNANNDFENALRTQFRSLLRKIIKGQEQGWSADEKAQITQIVEGGTLENMMRWVGKFAPTGAVSLGMGAGLPFAGAMQVTGNPVAAGMVAGGVVGTGMTGKKAAGMLQQQNINQLMQSMVQGRDMTPASTARLRAALTAYLSGQAAAQ